jgi:hypothetical protein
VVVIFITGTTPVTGKKNIWSSYLINCW